MSQANITKQAGKYNLFLKRAKSMLPTTQTTKNCIHGAGSAEYRVTADAQHLRTIISSHTASTKRVLHMGVNAWIRT